MDTQPNDDPNVPPKPLAGGVFIAIGAIVGPIAGGLMGQPSIGLLVGLVIGAGFALVVWLRGR